jgi:hypothetical protein
VAAELEFEVGGGELGGVAARARRGGAGARRGGGARQDGSGWCG